MKTGIIKSGAVMVALSFMLSVTPVAQAQNDEVIATATTTAGSADTATVSAENTYYSAVLETYAANGYTDYDGEPLTAVPSEDGLVGEVTLDGEVHTGVLWEHEEESVTFTVTVEKDGLYNIGTIYYPLGTSGSEITRELQIDGEVPFAEAESIEFLRFWKDENAPLTDKAGDEVRPFSVETPHISDSLIFDSDGKNTSALRFYLTAGEHEITFVYIDEPMFIQSVYLSAPESLPGYAEVLAGWQAEGKTAMGETIVFEAEDYDHVVEKTDSVIGVDSTSDPAATPSSPYNTKMNYIGGAGYKNGNQSIQWKFEVTTAGYYQLGLRVAQSYNDGLPSFRQIAIDGEVPFAEWDCYSFAYSDKWYTEVVADGDDQPYLLWLEAGEHTLTMTVKMDDYARIGETLTETTKTLSALICRIKKVTGEDPDTNYDYEIEKNVPGVVEDLQSIKESVDFCIETTLALAGGKSSSMSNSFDSISKQLQELIEKPDRIPKRLSDMETALGNLGTWINSVKSSPLGIDRIWLASPEEELKDYQASLFKKIWYGIVDLFSSFTKDYQSVSVVDSGVTGDVEIDVWVGLGTEWCRVIKQLADANFTPETGVVININVLPSSQLTSTAGVNTLMLSVASGDAPDVVLGLNSSLPLEYAVRNALVDLSQFDDFEETAAALHEPAFQPLRYNGKTYALPQTVSFRCVYYRTDVFEELGLTVPDTWDEFYGTTLPVLNQNGLKCYIPMLYDMFLFQNGGQYYTDDGHYSALDSSAAFTAFKQTCELNINYSIPVAANYFTRFRTGDIPMLIGTSADYLTFYSAAPELTGSWDIAPLPASVTADGTLCRYSSGSTVDCSAIMSQSEHVEESWEFLKWWMSDETQTRFTNEIENQMGITARWFSANTAAFSTLSFSKSEMAVINTFFENDVESMAVLGGYYTSRHINNAWTRCVESGEDIRDSWEEAVEDINVELRRKQEEYGVFDDE